VTRLDLLRVTLEVTSTAALLAAWREWWRVADTCTTPRGRGVGRHRGRGTPPPIPCLFVSLPTSRFQSGRSAY
jgi:hypothetical protein